jgi:hypothetical protein
MTGDVAATNAIGLVLWENLVGSKDSAAMRAQRDVCLNPQPRWMPLLLCLACCFLQLASGVEATHQPCRMENIVLEMHALFYDYVILDSY